MDYKLCPFLKKNCVKHECVLFTHLIGANPQTGQPTDDFGCSLAFLPILLVENSNMIRQNSSSTDKVANQIGTQRAEFFSSLPEDARQRLIQANPKLLTSQEENNVR